MRKILLSLFCLIFISISTGQPLIGITSVFQTGTGGWDVDKIFTQHTYVKAVIEAGGAPVVLPVNQDKKTMEKYLESLDGLLLVGGADIPPEVYGEKVHPTVVPLTPQRFGFESRLIKAWIKKTKKPLMGICLGMQFTNVMSGGTMIQDIPSEVGTKVVHRTWQGAHHDITIEKGTRLYRILGRKTIEVFSWHHQAVDKIGKNLVVTARSADNVVEAMEFKGDRFGLFTQWHPERMEKGEIREKLFKAFVKACGKGK